MSLLDITGYLVQLPGNAWLLPGSQGQIGAMLGSRAYEGVMVSLRRYFGVTVVDCETLPAEVARVALSAAQARILTAPATLEGVTSTYSVLQWMQGLPKHVIAGTVVVLTELVPHPGLDLAEAAEKLKSTGASVQVLPYDRHLAAAWPDPYRAARPLDQGSRHPPRRGRLPALPEAPLTQMPSPTVSDGRR